MTHEIYRPDPKLIEQGLQDTDNTLGDPSKCNWRGHMPSFAAVTFGVYADDKFQIPISTPFII
jgi:hypothetical protein